MYFSSWFASQLITLFIFLASPRTLAYNFYSYQNFFFIYLGSKQYVSMILIGNQFLLLWSTQGIPCHTLPFVIYIIFWWQIYLHNMWYVLIGNVLERANYQVLIDRHKFIKEMGNSFNFHEYFDISTIYYKLQFNILTTLCCYNAWISARFWVETLQYCTRCARMQRNILIERTQLVEAKLASSKWTNHQPCTVWSLVFAFSKLAACSRAPLYQ